MFLSRSKMVLVIFYTPVLYDGVDVLGIWLKINLHNFFTTGLGIIIRACLIRTGSSGGV